MTDLVIDRAISLVKEKLGLRVENYNPLTGGMNNQLFCLNTPSQKLLLKIYTQDNRNRLQREYNSFEFLKKNGFSDIPQVFFKDEKLNLGVYSFEEGISKKSEDLNQKNLETMVDFLIRLQELKPPDSQFLPAVMSCFSLEEYLKKIENRIENTAKALTEPEIDTEVKSFVQKTNILSFLKEKSLAIAQDFRKKRLPEVVKKKERRLSPVDFGAHNTIFKTDGKQVYVDFEYFGWDDPAEVVALFLNHDKSVNLSKAKKKFFLETYKNRSKLATDILKRLDFIIKLDALDWIGLLLGSITPTRVQYYIRNNPTISPQQFIKEQISKIEKRLALFVN